MKKTIATVFLTLLFCWSNAASADSTATGWASITVRSLPDSARVSVDTLDAGRTPVRVDSLTAGLHRLRLIHPDISNWLTIPIEDTVRLSPGEHRTLEYAFKQLYSLVSLPSGAEVAVGDSVVGTTPMTLFPERIPAGSPMKLRKNGFFPALVDLSLASRGVVIVALSPESGMPAQIEDALGPAADSGRLIIPGAMAVLSGGLAAYFKIKADDRHTAYLATGNPSYRAERNRLDNQAAGFLVGLEMSLALFIAFLLTQ